MDSVFFINMCSNINELLKDPNYILDGEFILHKNKVTGKLENNGDITFGLFEGEYTNFKLTELIKNCTNLHALKLELENNGYEIDRKGVVTKNKLIVAKVKKNNSIYQVDTSPTTLDTERFQLSFYNAHKEEYEQLINQSPDPVITERLNYLRLMCTKFT